MPHRHARRPCTTCWSNAAPCSAREQAEHLPLEPLADILGPARPGPADDPAVPVGGLGPIVSALAELPARPVDGVVLANELLDNLPFEIAVREPDGWSEVRVGLDGADLVEIRVPASPDVLVWIGELDVAVGARLPVPTRAAEWIVAAAHGVRRGSLWLIDYAAPWLELAARDGGWLRTYADHRRAGGPLAAPGSCDITVDVPLEMVERAARRAGLAVGTSTQAAWLRDLGIDDLVAEGAARWEAGAAAPDLEALAGRSRGMEAAALTDPRGLGAHTVFVLTTS